MLNIPVILGTIREGRQSENPAKLLVEKLKAAGVQTQLVDFRELPLPFIYTPKEPYEYKKEYPDENVRKWSKIADAADGFVIVTPEYNHGYPAILKNALDWLYFEFEHKAVGLVGVSNGAVGGARVIEQLRTIMGNFGMYDVRETVMFAKVQNSFDQSGKLIDESYNKKIDGLLKSLFWAAEALRDRRYADQKR